MASQQLYAKDGNIYLTLAILKMVRPILSLHYSKVSKKMQ